MTEKTLIKWFMPGVRILDEENFKINYTRSKNFLTVKVGKMTEKTVSR